MKKMEFYQKNIKGLLLISVIVLCAKILSSYIYIGSVTISIILGIIINYFFTLNQTYRSGINFSEKHFLNVAIILMGANLNFAVINTINYKFIFIIIAIILTTITSSIILGRIFKASTSLSFLIGIGNGICGSSAIAGASSIIESKKEDIAISISIINILGTIGIFAIPFSINFLFKEDVQNIGIIIGSTIQSVGQVTAAGFIINDKVGEMALLTKMIRILMLGPILIIASLFYSNYNKKNFKIRTFPIPYFIIGYIVFVIAINNNMIPLALIPIIISISQYSLLFAMTAIGLNISISSLFNNGIIALLIGFISFFIQIILSIYLFHNY